MSLEALLELLAYSQHVHDSVAVTMEDLLTEEGRAALVIIELQAPLN